MDHETSNLPSEVRRWLVGGIRRGDKDHREKLAARRAEILAGVKQCASRGRLPLRTAAVSAGSILVFLSVARILMLLD